MNPQVERLETLLARVQHNRKLPRPSAHGAAASSVAEIESIATPSQSTSLDSVVDDAEIVAETKVVRAADTTSSAPVLELEPHAPKAEARAPIDELDDPGTEPLPDLEPLDLEPPASGSAAAAAPKPAANAAHDPFFTEPPPAPAPEPPQVTIPRRSASESALAAAVQLAADEEPRTDFPAPAPVLEAKKPAAQTLEVAPASPPPVAEVAPPAPSSPAEIVPVAVKPAPIAQASGPIVKVAVAAPPAAAVSFGELVRRSIALRPI